jgi:Protein of unknown function (DUF2975)
VAGLRRPRARALPVESISFYEGDIYFCLTIIFYLIIGGVEEEEEAMAVVSFVRPDHPCPAVPAARVPDEAEIRLKIYGRLLSRCFLVLFALFVFQVAGCVLSLFLHFRSGIVVGELDGTLSFYSWSPLDYVSLSLEGDRFQPHDFPFHVCLLVAPLLIVVASPIALFLWFLFRLFGLYSEGQIFKAQNTLVMRRLGHAMMAWGYMPILCMPVFHWIGVARPTFAVTKEMLMSVFLGLVLLAISHVMEIGWRIQKEQEEII